MLGKYRDSPKNKKAKHVRGRVWRRGILRRAMKNVLHPIVRTHPVTGRKGLYVSPRFTVGIQDMDDAEAQPLLDTLFAYQTAPEERVWSQMEPRRFRDVGQSQRQSPGLRRLCDGRHSPASSHIDTRRTSHSPDSVTGVRITTGERQPSNFSRALQLVDLGKSDTVRRPGETA
jgi:hypothetical protein